MSTTTYCQPCDLSFSAITSACDLVCASVTVVAKQSQLFQPIGGFSTQRQNAGVATGFSCAPSAANATHKTDRTYKNLLALITRKPSPPYRRKFAPAPPSKARRTNPPRPPATASNRKPPDTPA